MKIVADDKIPFLKGILEQYAEVEYIPGDLITKSNLRDADALIIRSITLCNIDLLLNTSVKFIASATIGDDHIDKDFCKENNIAWTTAKGCNAAAVEQYFTAGLLALADKYQIDLSRKTIGIIGVGNIGKRVQKVSQLLGLKVLLNDPPRERLEGSAGFSTLDEIHENADIITLHTPLNYGGEDKTFHLIDREFFNGLKKPVVFINTSRGAVTESISLKNAIEEGKVKHTLVDVWEAEPDVDIELLELTDIATPHIAGYTIEGKARGTSMVVRAVSDYFNLGIDDWFPEIPAAATILEIDCSSFTDQEILHKVFTKVYPIIADDNQFRAQPDKFEQLRRNYRYRRENNTFYLRLNGITDNLKELFIELGFQFNEQKINIQSQN